MGSNGKNAILKPFHKKLIIGIIFIIALDAILVFFLFTEQSGEYLIPKVFLFSFKGGVILWLFLNYRESKKVKAKREREKGRIE